ncbi:MAG TPA: PQQ-dependent sugar dehydrogenase [Pyrinomonadaceae bacterium]|nr:PQQ-dependent sugar dehydrogenase [Pyrinomonadaceae bacterium]
MNSSLQRARSVAAFIFASFVVFCVVPQNNTRAATVPTGFTDTLVAGNLSNATAFAFAPDGRIFVCLQDGNLRVVKNGALLPTPFLTVTVSASGERGLLGVAFDPNFASNNYVYVYYTATTPAIHNRVSRFTANGDVAVAGSETILLELDNLSSATNHNGGAMHFGVDGKLYVAVGENATPSHSQTLANLHGKMLRINSDGSIPADNPFFNTATGKNRAIWALGLRNPYTFNFQPGTGRMFINDVGQNAVEEINDGIAGSNYGWPTCEGSCSNPNFRNPLFQYGHGFTSTTGCAITGGAFYNPVTVQFPASYVGKYFFADFCSNWIRLFDPASGTASDFASGASSPVDLQVSADGSLYYLQRGANGQLRRIQYPAGQTPPSFNTHPQSQTIAAGQPVTFNASATGSTPLQLQWQRNNVNIPNANGESYTISSVSASDNGAQFRCVATNAFGTATSNSATLTVTTANTAPTAQISTPPVATLYSAGDQISYSGTGTDTEDGTLPASAFTWQVDFHHDTHTHPFIPATTGATGGSFNIPTTGETAANVFYRIYLTVRDSGGLTHTVSRDVTPRTATLTLRTSPAGLQVTLDGQPKTDGYAELNVVGIQRTLGAPSQTLNGVTYNFVSWSDGGAATHNINVPAANTTYTAVFAKAANTREVLITEYRLDGPGGLRDEFVELYNNTNEPITVSTSDGSAGWALVTGRDGASGVALETYRIIPNGVVIPPRAHYLVAGSGYTLGAYGGANRALADLTSQQGDLSGDTDAQPFRGVALFRTADANNFTTANRLDAAGGACADARLSEGRISGLCRNVGTATTPAANYSLVRKQTSGTPQDTDNNADDFTLVAVESPLQSAAAGTSIAAELGAPAPENLGSPTEHNATIKAQLIDPQAASFSPPNRVRAGGQIPNGQFGTLTIRRRFTNKTGRTVLALRFRLTGITTLGSPVAGTPQADLRAASSSDTEVQTTGGNVLTVRGTVLEQPPTQTLGGGFNSTLVVPLTGGALIPNASIDVQFVLGVQQEGAFRFFVNVEALTQPVANTQQKGEQGKTIKEER